MSELSFRVFCIEGYSRHTGKPGNELYDLFQREGLLALLKSDYEDLHGMGIEWLVNFFDEYLFDEYLGREKKENHSLARMLALPSVIEMIMERYGMDEDTALDAFYRSATASVYADDETGLYGQSPHYVSGLFFEEIKQKGLLF